MFRSYGVAFLAFGFAVQIFSPSLASAQGTTPLSLNEAISHFQQSPRIERVQSAAEEASWKRVESYGGFLPSVSASAQRLLNREWLLTDVQLPGSPAPITIPQILPTTVYGLAVNWTVFDGFANVERFRSASALETAGKQDLGWAKFQGSRDVVLLFYKALAAATLREVAQANLKTLEDHLNDVQLFKKAGTGTKFDVLRVDVQASEARSEVLNATDNVSVSMLRLGEQLGEDLSDRTLQGTLPVLDESLVKNLAYDEGKRGDIGAMRSRVEGLDRAAHAGNGFWYPKVGLGAQFQHYNNRDNGFSGDGFRDAYSVGVNLNWELLGAAFSYARDRQAVEQRVQAEKSLILTQQKSKNDFEFWRRRYLYFASVYRSRTSDVEKSTESVRLAREGRRVGTRTNTDLLDAESELFRARAGLVNSQIGAIEALINLEVATGQSLFKFN